MTTSSLALRTEYAQPVAIDTAAQVMLSVVIPAWNEEAGIGEIISRVQSIRLSLPDAGVDDLEIIIVDDGSSDRTAEIAASFSGVRVVRHPRNRGYGAAIKTGFACARGQLLAFLDADGTYPPESFSTLCRLAIEENLDLVVGSRRSGATSEMPFVRRIGNFAWSNLVSLLGNCRVADPASGMRVIRKTALARLYPLPDGLNFTPVMSTRAVHEGLTMSEVPIAYRERVGRSKLSIIRDGSRFLTTIIWTALEYNPVRVLGIAGAVALALAGVIGAALLVARLEGVTALGTWGILSTFGALLLAVAGTSIFSLGATFNYLVSLFRGGSVRQGLFGRPLLDPPLERHFGWAGVAAMLIGVVSAGVSATGLLGADANRLWFWLVISALLILVGLQLTISWILMRVLDELSRRASKVREDLMETVSDLPAA